MGLDHSLDPGSYGHCLTWLETLDGLGLVVADDLVVGDLAVDVDGIVDLDLDLASYGRWGSSEDHAYVVECCDVVR